MKLLCPYCHSENISRDASAKWNGEKWELSCTYDDITCDDCGRDFYEANEIELSEVTL